MNNTSSSESKIPWLVRIAYGLGDTAQNIVWGAMGSVLIFFYTDYAGVNPVVVGSVMLLSRIFDGFSDIIMGFIVEKTHSKYGKSRPWILWMSVPFAASIVLIFTVPQTTETLQFIYLFVTYNFCTTICYTAINLPYGSLSAMMTRSSRERDMLSITRMALSPIGKILAVSATLPLIKILGDTQMAWIEMMTVWAILALILLLFCFFKCKETVVIKARKIEEKIPMKRAIKALLSNKYFYIVMILWTMLNVISNITGTILPYYCKYVFSNDSWFSLLYLVEALVMVGFTFISPTLLKRFGKRNMSLAGITLALIGHLIFLLNPLNFYWVLFSCIVRGIGLAPLNSVIFGFLGDVIEYGQWKTHLRQEGLIFSGGSVGTKIGSGLTAAILTGLLSMAGYISSSTGNVVQSQSAIDMIIHIYMYGPIIVWLIIIIALLLYKLDKIYPKIMNDLVQREASGKL